MKSPSAWNPAALLQSLLFTPLYPLLSGMEGGRFPDLCDYNRLLENFSPAISVQGGNPLRFVPQERGRLGFEAQYEPRCYLTGEVQTRAESLHDLFNALVWLVFPKAKAAINSRHYQALTQGVGNTESQRGRVRDMATLLDESGVIVACADAELAELLRNFQWKELFWQRREQVQTAMGFYIFGHGLYEKAMQPYIGMTGQGLVIDVERGFFNLPLPERMRFLDARVSEYLSDSNNCVSTRELTPVPLLGVPGWAEENDSAVYYDNTAYFRPSRRDSR